MLPQKICSICVILWLHVPKIKSQPTMENVVKDTSQTKARWDLPVGSKLAQLISHL